MDRQDPDWKDKALSTRLLHGVMVTVSLSIVFLVSGSLAFLLLYGRATRGLVAGESETAAWIRFGVGGVIGVVAFVVWYRRKF